MFGQSDRTAAVVAHRGDPSRAPENTMPAFDAALELGVDMIEFDFRQTKDGELVCIHDATFDRTTDSVERWGRAGVRVDDVTIDQARELDAGSWMSPEFEGARVPTLEDALRRIQTGSVGMIERKAGDPERLVELLRRMDIVEDVIVQSLDWDWVARVSELEPKLRLGLLGGSKDHDNERLTSDLLRRAERIGAWMVHWDHTLLNAEDVASLRACGFFVCIFTADEVADFERLVRDGVQAITTNQPARLQQFLRERAG